MGLFDRARSAFGLDGAEAREVRQERSARDERWGRIVTSVPPRKHEPEDGEDIAVSLREGDQTVGHEWQIDRNDPPQYGIPTPTQPPPPR